MPSRLDQRDLQRGAFVMERMISNQAAQLGSNEIFHLLGIIFLVVLAFVSLVKPPFAANAGPAAASGH